MSWDDRYEVTEPLLRVMAGAIAHRGPDGEAIHLARTRGDHPGQIGFAFRRLAVLDPDPRAMQPMTTPDGKCTIAFNGEIYNYKDLKSRSADIDWRTTGDTEVLLHLLAARGTAALDDLNGMFAIALWNAADRSLLLIRDRMGQKPLYYTIGRGSIAFASELPALRAWPHWDRSIDDAALTHYLEFGRIDAPRTIHRGVRQLEPGTWMRIFADGHTEGPRRYFDPNTPPPNSQQPTPTDFRTLIERAVERQLVSDVPLGIFLSGGIDSSIIAACAQKRGPVETFSIGFDDPRYDETKYAEAVARHLGTKHHTFRVTPDAAADLPALAAVFGEPFGDSSALPTHYLARETRKHVTVALSGDGGDELFGGYDRYRAIGMNLNALRPFATLGRRLSRGHPKSQFTRLGRLLQSASLAPSPRYRSYMTLFDRETIRALLGERAVFDDDTRFDNLLNDRTPMEAALAYDRVTYLPNDLLTKVDRCSMLHALEVRSPFMDHDVVQHAAMLRGNQLMQGGPKRMLREAFQADLPAEVFRRKKMGFAVPIGDWLRTSLKPMLHETLLASLSVSSSMLVPTVVRTLITEHTDGRRDHSQQLYALLILQLWQRKANR